MMRCTYGREPVGRGGTLPQYMKLNLFFKVIMHTYFPDFVAQIGSAKPDGITSHKMKAGEAGASEIAQRDTNTTLSKKGSASNRSVGAV
ncbi:hypothetical protein GW17_00008711 [Ensete ventricosum]|nr:hypothetical protein GW17_00008711 [Ensete ventricosum]